MRRVLLILTILAPARAWADIASFSGTVSHGSTITFQGSFDPKIATVTIWDDFENGSFNPRWASHNNFSIVDLVEPSTGPSLKAAYLNFVNGADDGKLERNDGHKEWYVTYRVMISTNWDWGTTGFLGNNKFLTNIKPVRFYTADDGTDNNFYLQMDCCGNTRLSGDHLLNVHSDTYTGALFSQFSFTSSTWHRITAEFSDSTTSQTYDAHFILSLDNKVAIDTAGVNYRGTNDKPFYPFDIGWPNAWGANDVSGGSPGDPTGDDAPNEYWEDDVYTTASRERIEVSTCGTNYRDCSVMVPQWDTGITANSATIILNLNQIPSDKTAYAWYTDASGVHAASGFALTAGGGGGGGGGSTPASSGGKAISGNARFSGNVRIK